MTCQYPHIEALSYAYGEWINRDVRRGGRIKGGSTWHTITTSETHKRYWQPCMQCWGTGTEIKQDGVIHRPAPAEDRKNHRCPACNGRRGRYQTEVLSDPAAIPATGPGGMYVPAEDVPEDFQKLEDALNGMGEVNRAVFWSRYVAFPREHVVRSDEEGRKRRLQWVREAIWPKEITEEAYKKRLARTKARLAEIFGVPVRREAPDEQRQTA